MQPFIKSRTLSLLYRLHLANSLKRIGTGWRILLLEGPAIFLSRFFHWFQRRVSKSRPIQPSHDLIPSRSDGYQAWVKQNEPGPLDLTAQEKQSASFSYQPLISIIIPVYNISASLISAAFESIRAQSYSHWEICLANSSPEKKDLTECIEQYASGDSRIHQLKLDSNLGISGNSNSAVEMAKGEFLAFLDHDDTLAPFALYEVVKTLQDNVELDIIYSDHDLLTADGRLRFNPLFKPDWSPETMLSANYITHLTIIRTGLFRQIGGFRPETDGAQDWDLFFRIVEKTNRISHIPKILYHWRDIPGSTSSDIWNKPLAPLAQLQVITSHLQRIGKDDARAFFDPTGFIRVHWSPAQRGKVSIIIPTRGAPAYFQNCLHSILRLTDYPNYEIIIVNNGEEQPHEVPFFLQMQANPTIKIVHFDSPFNYSAVNNFGARHASGDILLFLNNDTQIVASDWLSEMAMWAESPQIGVVGAKLLYENGSIQHAGVILGLTGFAGHIFAHQPENTWGSFGLAEWYRDYLAVTGACLMIRRQVFESVDGFNEQFLLCGSDVELCLRVRDLGLQVVYNPFARLRHLESISRQGDNIPWQDFEASYRSYKPYLDHGDPYFNPNLSYWNTEPSLRQELDQKPADFVSKFLDDGRK